MSTCRIRDTLIAGMILAFAAAAAAQEDANSSETPRSPNYGPGGSTLINLLANPRVQTELGLTESESKRLLDSLREIDPTNPVFRTPEERQQGAARVAEMMDAIKRKSEAAIQNSLSEEQFRRFQQLELQYQGGLALSNPEIAQRLVVTAAQRKTLETLQAEFRLASQANRSGTAPGTPRPDHESVSARMDKYKADLLAVLTPEQANQWQAMTGVPFGVPKVMRGFPFQLVELPDVQKELGLSEGEAATLARSLAAIEEVERVEHVERLLQTLQSNRAASSPDDRRRQLEDRGQRSRRIVDTVKSSLTVSQWNRLQEVILQQRGMSVLAQPDVANKLGLSREQRDRVRETMDKYRREATGNRTLLPKPGDSQAHRQKEQADLLDILTPEQKTKWEAMQGAQADLGNPLGIR